MAIVNWKRPFSHPSPKQKKPSFSTKLGFLADTLQTLNPLAQASGTLHPPQPHPHPAPHAQTGCCTGQHRNRRVPAAPNAYLAPQCRRRALPKSGRRYGWWRGGGR